MSSSSVPYPLRMPEKLREYLTAQAKEHNRSLHAEIVGRLQESMDGVAPVPGGLAAAPAGQLLEEVIDRLGARVQIIITKDAAEQEGIDPGQFET